MGNWEIPLFRSYASSLYQFLYNFRKFENTVTWKKQHQISHRLGKWQIYKQTCFFLYCLEEYIYYKHDVISIKDPILVLKILKFILNTCKPLYEVPVHVLTWCILGSCGRHPWRVVDFIQQHRKVKGNQCAKTVKGIYFICYSL